MKKIQILAVCLLLIGVAAFTSGCGEKAAEKTAEKIIETSTGGQVDVDIDDDSVSINTNSGSMSTSDEGVSLPDGFPSDVYVVDGTIVTAITNTESDGYSLSIVTNKSVAETKEEYEADLEAEGWTITMTLNILDGASIAAEKDDRSVSVSISQGDDGTTVMLGTSNNSN
ncbi:hypothetical protein KKF61_00235 [Patescibacteria group bacterium]|nr:hypothetical protein [Patescibacteria group bacterium]MBU0964587.1 hypothetical protein [Patescibacteria group bacterium]